jgi:ArsR family transcriptional regulator
MSVEFPCAAPATPRLPRGGTARRASVELFRALADPTRLEILALIAAEPEPVCVCNISACFDVSQPTISHHLKVLREARLVEATRRGTWSYYTLTADSRAAVTAAIDAVLPPIGARPA